MDGPLSRQRQIEERVRVKHGTLVLSLFQSESLANTIIDHAATNVNAILCRLPCLVLLLSSNTHRNTEIRSDQFIEPGMIGVFSQSRLVESGRRGISITDVSLRQSLPPSMKLTASTLA